MTEPTFIVIQEDNSEGDSYNIGPFATHEEARAWARQNGEAQAKNIGEEFNDSELCVHETGDEDEVLIQYSVHRLINPK
jgi:hypothetical protein